MRKSRVTESRIVRVLKEVEGGRQVIDVGVFRAHRSCPTATPPDPTPNIRSYVWGNPVIIEKAE